MKRSIALLAVFLGHLALAPLSADPPEVGGYQNTYEKDLQSVVRNKKYFKAGKFEIGIGGGLMPYDSTFDQYTLGARLTWHISDHFGWEMIEYSKSFSSVTGFTRSIASNADSQVQNLQAVKVNSLVGTNLLISPLYGKVRLFGVIYLDIYMIAGLGLVNTSTMKYTYVPVGSFSETQEATGSDFSINYGVGFKFFMNNAFTCYFDMRNYMANSLAYGRRGFHSNFTASAGLSIFLPNFG